MKNQRREAWASLRWPRLGIGCGLVGIGGEQIPLQAVPLHEAVQRRTVHAGDAGGLGHVASRLLYEPREVTPLEGRQEAFTRGVIALSRRTVGLERARGLRRGTGRVLLLADEGDILGL